MAILADRVAAVVAVDTHTDTHSAAVLSAAGAVLAQVKVGTDPAGLAALTGWADRHCPAGPRAWVLDGSRSHGVGLTRHLRATRPGDELIEAARDGSKARRRRNGKSDALDAVEIGRSALTADQVATPRSDGDLEALRLLLVARRHYTDMRTASVNLFKATILTAPTQLREHLRTLSTAKQIKAVTRGVTVTGLDRAGQISLATLTTLARDIAEFTRTLKANEAALTTITRAVCAPLLDLQGVGAVTAATVLTAWSHKGRIRNEAAYAKLGGVCPLEASSGQITRHRLNRGGDRTLNSALYTIAITRRRHHEPTRAYVARRTAEGLTSKEITRCLKRYLARTLYRIMETHATSA